MKELLSTVPFRLRVVFRGQGTVVEAWIDDLKAANWIEALLVDDLGGEVTWTSFLFKVISNADQLADELPDMLVQGHVTADGVAAAAQEALETAAGRPWWEVINIMSVAAASWDSIGGELALRGILPAQVTLGVWLDAAWLLLRRLAAQKDEQSLDMLITAIKERPRAVNEGDDGEMDLEAFMAAANELPGTLSS